MYSTHSSTKHTPLISTHISTTIPQHHGYSKVQEPPPEFQATPTPNATTATTEPTFSSSSFLFLQICTDVLRREKNDLTESLTLGEDRLLVGQLFQDLGSTSQAITRLADTAVDDQLVDLELSHRVLIFGHFSRVVDEEIYIVIKCL